jgi:hypothetical protein
MELVRLFLGCVLQEELLHGKKSLHNFRRSHICTEWKDEIYCYDSRIV